MVKLELSTSSDGKNTEGIGAMAQYQLFCYGLSKHLGYDYSFSPFDRLQHYQYFDVTQEEFCKDVNNLFEFDKHSYSTPDSIRSILEPAVVMREGQKHLNDIKPYLQSLELTLPGGMKYFSKRDINVAIHIRVYTKTDCDPSPIREYFGSRSGKRLSYYANIMRTICSDFPDRNVVFHIYSQGEDSDFEEFKNLGFNVKLHIEEYPTISLYHMAYSDVLVMANSSLSYIAHLLGKTKTYASQSFYHKLYEDAKLLNDLGEVIL